jgi:hypothetical protein
MSVAVCEPFLFFVSALRYFYFSLGTVVAPLLCNEAVIIFSVSSLYYGSQSEKKEGDDRRVMTPTTTWHSISFSLDSIPSSDILQLQKRLKRQSQPIQASMKEDSWYRHRRGKKRKRRDGYQSKHWNQKQLLC